MTQKEKKKKARYGVGGNVIYMFALAFRQCRQVPLILLCQVLLGVGENLLGLFVAPVLLGELEAAVPAGTLVRSILLFSLGLIAFSAAARYLRTAALYGRVEVRSWLSNAINMKILRTSFPKSLKADFREMYAGASEATSANDRGRLGYAVPACAVRNRPGAVSAAAHGDEPRGAAGCRGSGGPQLSHRPVSEQLGLCASRGGGALLEAKRVSP